MALPPTIELWNGVAMPRVGLGTYKLPSAAVAGSVVPALAAGYRLVDTAVIYQNEKDVARAIKQSGVPRREVFITSKLSPYQQGTAAARAGCEQMLQNLKVDDEEYVDLVLIHWPGASKTAPSDSANAELRLQTWRVLEEMYTTGRFKAIGVSNYEPRHIRDLLAHAAIKPHVNQVELHPQLPQAELRALCASHGIAVTSYSSLGTGKLLSHPVVVQVAQQAGVSPAQVLLRWALQKGCTIIPKCANPAHLLPEAELRTVALSADHEAQLDALAAEPTKYCWDPSQVA